MATYRIRALYAYEGDVEANSPDEAEKLFLADLNDYYSETHDYEWEKVPECAVCGELSTDIELEPYTCDKCEDENNG
jgi:hypothetical protein